MARMRPLLVGEANPYGGPPGNALIPDPPHCAGWNLCHRILQLSEVDYYDRFERVNLCRRDWVTADAKSHARVLADQHAVIVMLGAKVTRAFEFDYRPFTDYGGHPQFICLPHPSGLSRAWNEPGAFERARAVLREAGVL